jgi:hypothetical protein
VEEGFSASLAGCAEGGLSDPPGFGVKACRITAKKSSLADGSGGGGTVEREASSAETPLALGAGV